MLNRLSMLLLATSLSQAPLALAAETQPFTLNYKANYGNLEAGATRSLSRAPDSGNWEMKSRIEVKVLGATVTSIEETSSFSWQNELPIASSYDYVQKGIGKRHRKLEFAASGQSARYTINDQSGELKLTPPVFDNLTSGLMLRKHIQAGETDISFTVADKSEASTQHYQVTGKESIVIPAGTFNTVHVQRIRDGNSKRTTDIWLAPDHDYVMVKLLQTEPDGDTISLQLKSGVLGTEKL